MKIRNGFVSNSSSSSFLITNKTNKDLTMLDFVKENKYLCDEFHGAYGYRHFTKKEMLQEAAEDTRVFPAGQSAEYDFGDEDGRVFEHVFDYMLREHNESKSFTWELVECRGWYYGSKAYLNERNNY